MSLYLRFIAISSFISDCTPISCDYKRLILKFLRYFVSFYSPMLIRYYTLKLRNDFLSEIPDTDSAKLDSTLLKASFILLVEMSPKAVYPLIDFCRFDPIMSRKPLLSMNSRKNGTLFSLFGVKLVVF